MVTWQTSLDYLGNGEWYGGVMSGKQSRTGEGWRTDEVRDALQAALFTSGIAESEKKYLPEKGCSGIMSSCRNFLLDFLTGAQATSLKLQ